MNQTPKIIGYIRVSTDKQNTQVQKTEILEYGHKTKSIIDDFITVEISSRKSQAKRKIEQLKEQLQSGDTVIVTELSRLGRSMIEILNLIEWFKEHQVTVIFTKQPELSTQQDNALQSLLFSIYGYFAESERELISERVKHGIINARKQGKQIGRKKGSTGKSIFDNNKDRIFELHNLGLSYAKIIKQIGYGTAPALGNFIHKIKKLEAA